MSKEIVADLIEKLSVDCFFEWLVDKLLYTFLGDQWIHAKDIVKQVFFVIVANRGLILFRNLLKQIFVLFLFEVEDDMVLLAEV